MKVPNIQKSVENQNCGAEERPEVERDKTKLP